MSKITMQHMAERLGVSKYVISKALSGKPGVRQETRERVVRLAAQLGYFIRNKPASAPLAAGREYEGAGNEGATIPAPAVPAILVLMPDVRYQTKGSEYWGKLLDGITSELDRRKLGTMVLTLNAPEQLAMLRLDSISGIVGIGEISHDLLLELQRLQVPLVLLDPPDAGLGGADHIFANNRECAFLLTQYLIGLGHSSIHFVGNTAFSRSFRERYQGYAEAMEANGLHADFEGEDALLRLEGADAMLLKEQLTAELGARQSGSRLPTAFVCANDRTAVLVIQVLEALGLAVPRDVSVTGFDDIDDAAEIGLTTVHVDKEWMGKRAVDKLLWRLAHKEQPWETLFIGGAVTLRSSAAQPGSKQVL